MRKKTILTYTSTAVRTCITFSHRLKEASLAQKRTVDVKNALSNHARRYHPDGPMSPQPSPRALREYIVTSDDHSLSLIAKKLTTNSGRFTEMATLNKITHPFTIEPGQVLLIPPTW